jgi:hypothetical protein
MSWSSRTDGSLVEHLARERGRAAPARGSSTERRCQAAEKVVDAEKRQRCRDGGGPIRRGGG